MKRRHIAAGAVASFVAGMAFWEKRKLDGAYDWSERLRPTATERWRQSLDTLSRDPLAAEGAIVHVGQSTHLIALGGRRLLTDPWFHDPAFGCLAHERGPAVAPENVGALDWLLVTHEHPDHCDPKAMDRLDKSARVLTNSDALKATIKKLGFSTVDVLAPWETVDVAGLVITAVPAIHDIPEVGFVVKSDLHTVYFAGDTNTMPEFKDIQERLAPTFAILPVDGTRLIGGEQWVMRPEDAVAAAKVLGVSGAMPSHADAYFSDPLVAAGLASTIAGANELVAKALEKEIPGIRAENPAPGELVMLGVAA